MLHTYKTFVRPPIDYRFLFLSPTAKIRIDRLDQLERRIIRRGLHWHHSTSSSTVYHHTGLERTANRFTRLIIKCRTRCENTTRPQKKETLLQNWSKRRHLTRKPKLKFPWPPSIIHQCNEQEDQNDDLDRHMEYIPITIKYRRY